MIYFLTYIPFKIKSLVVDGRKKSQVWDYFDTDGVRKHGHVGCICKGCGWKRAVGKACEMVEHLEFSYPKASGKTKQIFMEKIRNRMALN